MDEKERLDRLAHSMQNSPEQQTAEAAANRKYTESYGQKPHNSYIADLNGSRVTPDMLRKPSGIELTQLIRPGIVVKTSYGSGPYIVESVHRHEIYGHEEYSLILSGLNNKRRKDGTAHRGDSSYYYLNELVAVDGRILHLFVANKNEVFIVEGVAPEKPVQSKLL